MLGTLHPLCHRQLRVERLVKIENLEIKANFKPQVVRHKLVAYNLQFDIAICDLKFDCQFGALKREQNIKYYSFI